MHSSTNFGSVGSPTRTTGGGTQAVDARRDSAVSREIETGKKIGAGLHELIDRLAEACRRLEVLVESIDL